MTESDVTLVEQAAVFAIHVHQGMRRKAGGPYILHPMETAVIIGTLTDDPRVIAAGFLHDAVEDTSCTVEDIRNAFGDRVAQLVAYETENKRRERPASETWKIRKTEALERLRNCVDRDVKIIAMGDKLSNLRSLCHMKQEEGDSMWLKFHMSDPKEQEWYYRSCGEVLSDLKDTDAWQEYHNRLDDLFGLQQ